VTIFTGSSLGPLVANFERHAPAGKSRCPVRPDGMHEWPGPMDASCTHSLLVGQIRHAVCVDQLMTFDVHSNL
jgi:hypothetical protein